MGFWKKAEKPAPPTTIDHVAWEQKGLPKDELEEKGQTPDIEGQLQRPHHASSELERRVVRKLDLRVVPLLSALYLLAFLDRSNIGNARIAGMEEALDLDPHGSRYQWLLNIFYIAYILFEFFALMWKIVPPNKWAAFVVFGWGIAATLQSTTQAWATEMVCRFFLGLFEAGFGPGIPYLLSFFYLRHELGLRIGIFLSAAPLATTFAGALAYGITSGHSAMANWRLLFLVEGLPTIIMAAVAYRFLPVSPEQARFLNQEEALVAKARGVRQVGDVARVGGIVWRDIGATLIDAKPWITALMYFSTNVGFSSLPVFLPTILEEMGYSSVNAQGLTAPPFFLSFLITIISVYVADKTQQRGLTVIVMSTIGFIGYVLLASCKTVGVRYFGVFLAAAGIFPTIANILPWVLNNQGSDTRRGTGIAILNFIGQCGPLLGTNIFPKTEGPRYTKGMWVSAAFTLFTAFLALGLRILLVWENKKLDQRHGPKSKIPRRDATDPASMETAVGEENYGPNFRFVL
ncbi:MAG: hypothetical protein L6R38_003718 [Xanthoria sp. 2 TBL-2021]|nr:MAG: hypothetical protein L6R38_003718 [Xanthoria sp. 2 TBL-2021]